MTDLHGPNDKHDFESLEHLSTLPPAEWRHLVPEILEWLQDINWPIFGEARKLLFNQPDAVMQPLREILGGDDDAWQYYCMLLIEDLPLEKKKELKDDLVKFRDRVDEKVDKDWDMKERVDEILSRTEEELQGE
ncbi:hypothetical protein VKT23_015181 [Stygiomarasmius scandens]|uniref:DUF5071 domain-containing protein n=1 Tax=Marasmiellus scandens TaxID=2682957 RepID=A0ABR1IZL4_9AGAR